MRLSVKPRYALASLIVLAQSAEVLRPLSLLEIAETLKLSKIYLEQVFALLKRGGLVVSVKGGKGGYRLAKEAHEISVFEIINATESALFETTEATLETAKDNPNDLNEAIEATLHALIFKPLDAAILKTLKHQTLADLLAKTSELNSGAYMYFL